MIEIKIEVPDEPQFDALILAKNLGKAFLKSKTHCRWAITPDGSGGYRLAVACDPSMLTTISARLEKALEKSMAQFLRWRKMRQAGR
jgi:hypothetical protein